MKNTIQISLLAIIFFACNPAAEKTENQSQSPVTEATETQTGFDTTKLKTGDAFYQCEMDPDVLSDKPGSCSKCGMDLSERSKL